MRLVAGLFGEWLTDAAAGDDDVPGVRWAPTPANTR